MKFDFGNMVVKKARPCVVLSYETLYELIALCLLSLSVSSRWSANKYCKCIAIIGSFRKEQFYGTVKRLVLKCIVEKDLLEKFFIRRSVTRDL